MVVADNNNHEIYEWVCKKLGYKAAQTITVGVLGPTQRLLAGISYFKKGHVCLISAAAQNSSWCMPETLSELLRIPFEILGCKVAKFETSHKNDRANKFCRGIGCVKEGILRFDREDGTHTIVWSLTKKEISKKGWYRYGKQKRTQI